MAKYDPNWLQKAKAKQINKQIKELSHLEDKNALREGTQRSRMLCGQGWGAKGAPSIRTVMFPSVDCLPTCRQCREKYLDSVNVTYCACCGYPTCKKS